MGTRRFSRYVYGVTASVLASWIVIQSIGIHRQRSIMEDGALRLLEAGARLPDLSLDVHDAKLRNRFTWTRETTPVSALAGARCGLLIFFESSCKSCESLAPRWRGVRWLIHGADSLPVSWVTVNREDPHAHDFVKRIDAASAWYAVQSLRDVHDLGIKYWPQVYLIDRQGTFDGVLAQSPAEIGPLPLACRTTPQAVAGTAPNDDTTF